MLISRKTANLKNERIVDWKVQWKERWKDGKIFFFKTNKNALSPK